MTKSRFLVPPCIVPPLDVGFRPAALYYRAFAAEVADHGNGVAVRLGLQRPGGDGSVFETVVFPEAASLGVENRFYIERLVKFLIWQRGASRLLIGGPSGIAEQLKRTYSPDGARAFDYEFMTGIFETPFEVVATESDAIPDLQEPAISLGRHLDGNRIGFDLGASDYKVSAVIDGEVVYADEFSWLPSTQADIEYHYAHITSGLRKAAKHLPRVDAIGGSSAGVWIDDQVRSASIFRGLPAGVFESGAKSLVSRIRDEWGVPISVVNDGEVTALAGSMSLEANRFLGIAMGSSEAAGYVGSNGKITTWLNELAFTPIDLQPNSPRDEWSGEAGCGVQYFCQTGAIRLALKAGVQLDCELTPAQKLKVIQDLMANGDPRLPPVFETIGIWLGYTLAYYAEFYDVAHVLILGRVTTGEAGEMIASNALEVLRVEFPDIALEVHMPDERMKRVGQSVAAASLPEAREEQR